MYFEVQDSSKLRALKLPRSLLTICTLSKACRAMDRGSIYGRVQRLQVAGGFDEPGPAAVDGGDQLSVAQQRL